jgi:bifunctional UDP-N-acetylglucosamine pyrophosphorylase/glucosamine-1-phosphate N-acetyltransferase
LDQTNRENAQNEYYITDVIELLNGQGKNVEAYCVDDPKEVAGVNNVSELEEMRKYFEESR